MTFIVAILMAFAALGLPILTDIKKHGKDNILARSGREIIQSPLISSIFKTINDVPSVTLNAFLSFVVQSIFLVIIFSLIYSYLIGYIIKIIAVIIFIGLIYYFWHRSNTIK